MNARTNQEQSRSGNVKRRPLYQSAAEELAEIIAHTPPGDRLPSEPKLSDQLGVSRATLREAMRLFEERGLILRQQGVGTTVVEMPQVIDSGLEVLESLETLSSRMGLTMTMGDSEIRLRSPKAEELEQFDIPRNARLLEIKRTMLAEMRPVAYLVDVLPEGILPRGEIEERFTGSVLDLLLERKQPTLSHAKTEITAVSASPEIAHHLNIQRGDVLLCFKGIIYDDSGNVVNRSESYFLPWTFRFHVLRRFDDVMNVVERNRKTNDG
ncbi:MAG TPA: GntR family transcriptional regulator [Anaerolineae bacterium]|nr:GntR family transcriptional regulator [Anaerolineae bacterium]